MKHTELRKIIREEIKKELLYENIEAGVKGYLSGALIHFISSLFGGQKSSKEVQAIKKEFDTYIDDKIKNDPEFKSILDKIKAGETDPSKLV